MAAPTGGQAEAEKSGWQSFLEGAWQAWLELRYFVSKNFCPAEDLPLVEATEFFFDCLPNSEELTTEQRLAIMGDLRASVHAAVHDLYARQQEQRARRNSRSRAQALWAAGPGARAPLLGGAAGGGGGGGAVAGAGDEGETAARLASLAMAIYADQWEHLQHHEDVPRPFQLRAGPEWAEWCAREAAARDARARAARLARRAAARLGRGAGCGGGGGAGAVPLLLEDDEELALSLIAPAGCDEEQAGGDDLTSSRSGGSGGGGGGSSGGGSLGPTAAWAAAPTAAWPPPAAGPGVAAGASGAGGGGDGGEIEELDAAGWAAAYDVEAPLLAQAPPAGLYKQQQQQQQQQHAPAGQLRRPHPHRRLSCAPRTAPPGAAT